MIRMILREYRMSIHLEKLKKLFERKSFAYIFACIVTNMVLEMGRRLPEWKEEPVIQMLVVLFYLSIIWGIMVANMFSYQLPEIMFLLPLQKAERKKYVIVAYWIRVMLGLIPFSFICLLLVIGKEFHIGQALETVWVGFLCFAEYNLDLEWVENRAGYFAGRRLQWYGFWNFCIGLVCLLGFLAAGALSRSRYYVFDAFTVVLGIVLPTLFGMGIFYYWNPAMELAQNFEVIQLAESTSNRKRKWKTYVG